jgi:hypothetical protein
VIQLEMSVIFLDVPRKQDKETETKQMKALSRLSEMKRNILAQNDVISVSKMTSDRSIIRELLSRVGKESR